MSSRELRTAWNVRKLRQAMEDQRFSVRRMIDEITERLTEEDPELAAVVLPGSESSMKNRYFLEPCPERPFRGKGPAHPLEERVIERILSAPPGAFRQPERRKKP